MRLWQLGRLKLMLVLALAAFVGAGRADDDPDEAGDHEPPAKTKSTASSKDKSSSEEKKFRDFNEVIKGSEKIDGLFTLHRKDEHLYAEIKPDQFDQSFLAPIAIARGMAMAGQPLNFGDEWVLSFHRAGDHVQLIRKNTHYKAPASSPIEKSVKQNYTDSILMALPIIAINQMAGPSVLIDFSDIFLTDFAQLGFGSLDRGRTTWHKVKAFPNNLELEVEATFGGYGSGMYFYGFDDGVIDHRGRTLVIHYSLDKLPDSSYKPRYADHRVGHFLNGIKDFGSENPETNMVRMINRWRLEKADSKAKLSAPKKQIIWYVEDNVPHEFRPYVESGIREWNKAFEKIGFRDAIAVRWQEEGRDDFDPEDINYCTFRWITTSGTFAMSCLRSNPLTGEMIDGDVIFDASWIKYWKDEYALLTGQPLPAANGQATGPRPVEPLGVAQILSPIMAIKEGFGSPMGRPRSLLNNLANGGVQEGPKVNLVPAEWNSYQQQLRIRQFAGRPTSCQFAHGMRPEMGLAALAIASRASTEDDKDAEKAKDHDKDKEKDKDKKDDGTKLPEEFLGQLIKEVVMHEVGHSLGLRHNFHASTMLTADQINDTSITRSKGMVGSVMDYNPVNIVPKGQKQGDYCTTTIGPYDYWAIEYAYKPIDDDEDEELKKIAARSPEPDLVFATDEDFSNDDPLVNAYDLGSDPLRYAKDRIALATDLLKDLDGKIVKDGESYARVRTAFSMLLSQWGNAAYLVAGFVGGQSVNRDHKGKGSRDPISPIPATKQREALTFLTEQILSDRAFKFSPALLRRLGTEQWYDWDSAMAFMSGGIDYPINERILSIQRIALNRCLDANILSRLANQELQVDSGADTLRSAEVFRTLTNGIWNELSANGDGKTPLAISTLRRNLQREHLKRLSSIVIGSRRSPLEDLYGYVIFIGGNTNYPADARSLARMHLKEINSRISALLDKKDASIDDTTRAHLEESRFRIAKVLDAAVQSNEP